MRQGSKFAWMIVAIAILGADVLAGGSAFAAADNLDVNRAWHGRLMVAVWGVLFPAGIFAARFFKVMPNQRWPEVLDNEAWWTAHRICQYSGGLLMLVALYLIWTAPPDPAHTLLAHRIIGWAVVIFAASQFLGAWLRGSKGGPTDRHSDGSTFGDHYNMTPRRRAFELAHKSIGYVALATSVAAITTGLQAASAPAWMWLTLVAWWALLAALWLVLSRRPGRVDTYQAIWGPDPRHPGNRHSK